MEFIVDLIIAVIASGVVSGVIGWGIAAAKARWSLSPDAVESLEFWKSKIIDWVVEEGKDAGADLSIPDTRWKWVNKAIDQFVGYIPVLMSALDYSKEDLAKEVEREIRKLFREEVFDPSTE
jgi:hypothetical protein